MKRKLDQGLIEHPADIDENHAEFHCRVYENGRVVAGPEMLRKLSNFSEREIREGTGIRRDTIRAFRHGVPSTIKMYNRFSQFLKKQENANEVEPV